MGKEVINLAQAGFRGAELAAGVDINIQQKTEYPCYKNLKDVSETADCIVDFSNHQGTAMLLSYAVAKKIPVVVATTGHTDREILMIKEASKQIPVFWSANMSLAVHSLRSTGQWMSSPRAGSNTPSRVDAKPWVMKLPVAMIKLSARNSLSPWFSVNTPTNLPFSKCPRTTASLCMSVPPSCMNLRRITVWMRRPGTDGGMVAMSLTGFFTAF